MYQTWGKKTHVPSRRMQEQCRTGRSLYKTRGKGIKVCSHEGGYLPDRRQVEFVSSFSDDGINARGEKGKKNSALIITWGDEYKPIRICVNLPTNILLCISSHASPLE